MLTFDIETAGLPDDHLRKIYEPLELPEPPGEFDPSTVRVGGLKDPDKIAAKIDAAKKSHSDLVAGHDGKCKAIATNHGEEFKDRAALDAVTGRVIAIGYFNPAADKSVIDHGDERELIDRFWGKALSCRNEHRAMVGLNIHDFDLPFLVRRSWFLDVYVPDWAMQRSRYFDPVFVDLRKTWLCGQHGTSIKSSFDHLGKAFGTGGKPEGVSGGQFAELWETDREKAIAYLENDLRQPAIWAARMGII